MRPALGTLALLLILAVLRPAAVAGQSEDAHAAAGRALALVEQAKEAPETQRAELVGAARQALASQPELAASTWLFDPLDATPPEVEQARDRLAAAVAALEASREAPVEPGAARATLRQILDGPPFAVWSWLSLVPAFLLPLALIVQHLLDAIWNAMRWPFDRMLELLNQLFEGLFYTPAVLVLALLGAAGLVFLYRRGLRSAIVAQAEIEAAPGALPPTAAEALASAEQQAREGHFREACHFVFLSTLLWLDEQGRARFVPAATNREYLAQIAAQPSVANALAPVVARFDRLWYGQDQVSDVDYHDLLAAASRLRQVAA